jgi:hypothetical protein
MTKKYKTAPPLVCIFELIAKRDAAMGGAAFARQPCCLSFLLD